MAIKKKPPPPPPSLNDGVIKLVTQLVQDVETLKAQVATGQQQIVALDARIDILETEMGVEPQPPLPAEPKPPNYNEEGWTILEQSPDTQEVFVSDSVGDDSNDGLSKETPVKTIKRGVMLTRHNHPDWLRLKPGDVWKDQAYGWISGVNNGTARSGRSDVELMVFTRWDEPGPAPLILSNPRMDSSLLAASGGGGGEGGNFLTVVGIDHYAYTRDPSSPDYDPEAIHMVHNGISMLNPIDRIMFEDCRFSFYTGIGIQPSAGYGDTIFRRCVISDNYSINSHSQGMYIEGKWLTLEECLLDHNGWNGEVFAAYGAGGRTMFNHGLYRSATTYDPPAYPAAHSGPATIKNCIFSRNSAHGCTVNWGGDVLGSLFVRNAIGFHIKRRPDGTPCLVADNVITESDDYNPANPVGMMGWGMTLDSMSPVYTDPILVRRNIIAHNASAGHNQVGISYSTLTSGVEITDNVIYKWECPLYAPAVHDNLVEGNLIDEHGEGLHDFVDPTVTVGKYAGTQGEEATLEAFLAKAREQRKGYWLPEWTAQAVTQYFVDGFTLR